MVWGSLSGELFRNGDFKVLKMRLTREIRGKYLCWLTQLQNPLVTPKPEQLVWLSTGFESKLANLSGAQ